MNDVWWHVLGCIFDNQSIRKLDININLTCKLFRKIVDGYLSQRLVIRVIDSRKPKVQCVRRFVYKDMITYFSQMWNTPPHKTTITTQKGIITQENYKEHITTIGCFNLLLISCDNSHGVNGQYFSLQTKKKLKLRLLGRILLWELIRNKTVRLVLPLHEEHILCVVCGNIGMMVCNECNFIRFCSELCKSKYNHTCCDIYKVSK